LDAPDRLRLLHGPYRPSRLGRGDRVTCLLRDWAAVIIRWTAAPIPWPRCRVVDGPDGGSGLLLDEELGWSVRCESTAAVAYWGRVSAGVVWRWRKALGVTCKSNEGSPWLLHAAARAGGAAMRQRRLTEQEPAERRPAVAQDLKRFLRPAPTGRAGPGTAADARPGAR
jgi:hypothetical protein